MRTLQRLGTLIVLIAGLVTFVVPSASGDLTADGPAATLDLADGPAATPSLADEPGQGAGNQLPLPGPPGETAPGEQATTSVEADSEGEGAEGSTGETEAEANGEAPGAGASAPLSLSASVIGPIIGTNDAVGWGTEAALRIRQGHISWNRVELGSPTNTVASSVRNGFKVLLIVGNTSDGMPLSQIVPSQWGAKVAGELKANPSVSLAEAGNEPYLKGGVANPVQYGRMYMAAVEALKGAGVHTPLLFNMFGDYPRGSWAAPSGWSLDSSGGGWLHDALAAVPGLARAIVANGVAIHPYGEVGENRHDDYGVNAIAAEEAVTRTLLGSVPPFYVTEFGYDLSSCGRDLGACSKREQAQKLQTAYSVMLADPHIAGIWWYQSHDDGTGRFGYMNDNGTIRPAFKTLSTIAASVGQ